MAATTAPSDHLESGSRHAGNALTCLAILRCLLDMVNASLVQGKSSGAELQASLAGMERLVMDDRSEAA